MGENKAGRRRTRKARATDGEWIGISQAVAELGVSGPTLRRWVKEGKIEAVKVGKQWRFRREDLRRVVTVQPSAPATTEYDVKIEQLGTAALERLKRRSPISAEAAAALLRDLKPASPRMRLLMHILGIAAECGASELHLEPFEDGAVVRLRLDGVLTEVTQLPLPLCAALIAEVKRMGTLNLAETARPQNCRIILNLSGHALDLMVNVIPSSFGETAALMILDRAAQLLPLDRVGFEADDLARWRRIIRQPAGLALVNGAAGCGKTTVVYASLAELAGTQVKIMTAEDPVEFHLRGVTQTQIRPDLGLTYAVVARSMLRQGMNVAFIGEVRDRECAELLCQMAVTGHMVISTMHTNDAILAIRQMVSFGVDTDPFDKMRKATASALAGVTAQRLLRRICPDCKEAYRPTESEFLRFNVPADKRAGKFYKGRGCAKCRNLGYRGRMAVIQVLELNSAVRSAIAGGRDGRDLIDAVRGAGCRPMAEIALDKILRGETTIEEAVQRGLVLP